MDRVLISAKVFDEFERVDDYGLKHETFAWKVISWSKSEDVYHVETWYAPKYLKKDHTCYLKIRFPNTDHAWKERESTFASFPSEYLPDMRTMPMTMDGEPKAFVNARYAYDPDRLLKGHARKDAQDKTVPGTKVLKDNLEKLNTKTNINRKQGAGSRGQHA